LWYVHAGCNGCVHTTTFKERGARMFSKKLLGLLFALFLMTAGTYSHAANPAGNFGLGGEASLGGLAGVRGIYWFSDKVALQGVLNFDLLVPDGSAPATIDFGLAVGVVFNIFTGSKANFGLAPRLHFQTSKPGSNTTRIGLAIDVPIRVEFFISPEFSLHVETGIVLDLISQRTIVVAGVNVVTNGGFGLTTSFSGLAGFTYYF